MLAHSDVAILMIACVSSQTDFSFRQRCSIISRISIVGESLKGHIVSTHYVAQLVAADRKPSALVL